MTKDLTSIPLISSPDWEEYALLDSGSGRKLERFGSQVIIRPEAEAIWKPALPDQEWARASAEFIPSTEENGGHWKFRKPLQDSWRINYKKLAFKLQHSGSKQLGIFPEQAAQWDWIADQVARAEKPVNVLNLFGYTGAASLAAAAAGAKVTHLDASKKVVAWGKENQSMSGLADMPIRWIVDDAIKFVQREVRRGTRYEGIILDPPKFGRGPKGEVWEFYKLLPNLLADCRQILSQQPLFLLLTAYAVKASAATLYNAVSELMDKFDGLTEAGEVVLLEMSASRKLSMAVFARWSKQRNR